MQFFLYEIVARIVAIYLSVDSIRKIRLGLAERKIKPFNADVVNWILDSFRDPSSLIVHRDTAPVTYWISIGIEYLSWLLASRLRYLVVAPEHLSILRCHRPA